MIPLLDIFVPLLFLPSKRVFPRRRSSLRYTNGCWGGFPLHFPLSFLSHILFTFFLFSDYLFFILWGLPLNTRHSDHNFSNLPRFFLSRRFHQVAPFRKCPSPIGGMQRQHFLHHFYSHVSSWRIFRRLFFVLCASECEAESVECFPVPALRWLSANFCTGIFVMLSAGVGPELNEIRSNSDFRVSLFLHASTKWVGRHFRRSRRKLDPTSPEKGLAAQVWSRKRKTRKKQKQKCKTAWRCTRSWKRIVYNFVLTKHYSANAHTGYGCCAVISAE